MDHDEFALDPEMLLEIADFVHKKQQVEGGVPVVAGDNLGYYCEPPIRKHPWKGCFAGRHVMGIEADGKIKGCLSMPGELSEGNIRDVPLKEIWEDTQRFKYNRYFSPDMLEGYCKDCPKGDPCRAGCTTAAYTSTGSKFNNPHCVYRVAREKEKTSSG